MHNHSLAYIFSLLPIGLATVLFPPCSVFRANEYPEVSSCVNEQDVEAVFLPIYSSFPDILWNKKLIYSMLLDFTSQRKFCVRYQHFTSLFVHNTFGHIASDLWNLMKYAYPVFKVKGWMFMNTVYVLGGALARLPLLKTLFLTNHPSFITCVEDFVNSLAEPFFTTIDDSYAHWIVTGRKIECGGSPAVYALLGSGTVLALEKIFQTLFPTNKRNSDEDRISLSMFIVLMMNGWTVGTNLCALHREWELLQQENSSTIMTTIDTVSDHVIYPQPIQRHSYEGIWWQMLLPRHPYNENATVHVQGFLFGSIMTISSHFFPYPRSSS
jgi:hypothetical protein